MLPFIPVFLAGCATLGTFESARPIDPRTVEVGVEATALRTATDGRGVESTTPVSLSVRVGLDPRTEIGVRGGFSAPSVTVKRLLVPPSSRVAVSLAPALGVFPADLHGLPLIVTQGQVPLLVGYDTGPLEWVFGPELAVVYAHHREVRAWGTVASLGGTAGCSIRLARGLHVMPDVAVLVPAFFAGSGFPAGVGGGSIVQAGIGARVGGERR